MALYESFVFFFQAEDGIRDDLVTGVQTCALPISSVVRRLLRASQTYGYARRPRPRRVREVPRNQEILARGGTLRQQRRADREKCSRNRGWSAAFGKPAWRGREERLRPARSRRC